MLSFYIFEFGYFAVAGGRHGEGPDIVDSVAYFLDIGEN